VTSRYLLSISHAIIQRNVTRTKKIKINIENKFPHDPETSVLAFHWYCFLLNTISAPTGMYIIQINIRIEPWNIWDMHREANAYAIQTL